jgi:hypothetical protein
MSSSNGIGSASSTLTRRSKITTSDNLAVMTGNEPHITVSRLVIDKKTDKVLRHASAEFYLEGCSLSGQPRSTWNLEIKTDGHKAVLGLAYSGATVSGVDNIPDDWPEGVQELIREMAMIRDDCTLLAVPLAAQHSAHLKYIQSLLDQLHDEPGRLLASFRDDDKKPITKWDDMARASYQSKDVPQSTIKYCFPSLEVTAIKFCNGRYLEHRWQETIMAGLSGGTTVSFVVIGVDLVLAFVIYADRKQIKKNAQLDDHMTIQILVEVDDSSEEEDYNGVCPRKVIKSKGKLASNRIGIESDFSVLLEKPHKDVFSIAFKYGKGPVFIPATVTIEENARIAQMGVKAVHNLCQEGDNPHDQFQQMLLAEDTARAPPKNLLLEDVGLSKDVISTITNAVIQKLI